MGVFEFFRPSTEYLKGADPDIRVFSLTRDEKFDINTEYRVPRDRLVVALATVVVAVAAYVGVNTVSYVANDVRAAIEEVRNN